jgi:hypothetical protein
VEDVWEVAWHDADREGGRLRGEIWGKHEAPGEEGRPSVFRPGPARLCMWLEDYPALASGSCGAAASLP